jgi:intracellular multiplication protein IcmD
MKSKKFFRFENVLKVGALLAALVLLFWGEASYAANPAPTGTSDGIALSTITNNVNNSVYQLARILTDIALITGVGFVLASFFKFHQHKLNPTQVPISQGVTLLLIGAALLVFVLMLPTAKRAVFGSTAQMTKIGGTQLNGVIGGGTAS